MHRKVMGYLVLDRRGEMRLLKLPPRRLPGTLAVQFEMRVPEEFFDPPGEAKPLESGAPVVIDVNPLPPLRIQRAEPKQPRR